MNGVVFHTSVAMITRNESRRLENGSVSGPRTKRVAGLNAYFQANAATTVTIPYGIRIAVRTGPRPKIARCITSAISIPSTSSIATDDTVMITVLSTSSHHVLELSTWP